MDDRLALYLLHPAITIGTTVLVGRTLSRNGLVFLADVLADGALAAALNRLLLAGFYLITIGYVTVTMGPTGSLSSAADVLLALAGRVGPVLIVLGLLHLLNVFALSRYRRTRLRRLAAVHLPRPLPPPPPGWPGARPGRAGTPA
ncbi:hypothetical protein GCM10010123_11710 [Pilimelia anulata]|uniref:Uncharacterized protein n=1 Tax=Pilimelia anulata TaxID=53371 RepID=A0A8J3B5C1_9ACTN|nr:hypothetical protein [Pilimelia anulata]GGJ83659.1 hypothetical protein GCM10010123_11710 [Pilimelia anulata]